MQFRGKYLPSVSASLWGYWHKFVPSSNPKEKSLANKGAMKSLFVVISVVLSFCEGIQKFYQNSVEMHHLAEK